MPDRILVEPLRGRRRFPLHGLRFRQIVNRFPEVNRIARQQHRPGLRQPDQQRLVAGRVPRRRIDHDRAVAEHVVIAIELHHRAVAQLVVERRIESGFRRVGAECRLVFGFLNIEPEV